MLAATNDPEPDLSWIRDESALRRLEILFRVGKTGWALGVFSRESDRDALIEVLRRRLAPVPVFTLSFEDHDHDPLVCLSEMEAPPDEPAPIVCFTGIFFAIPELALHLDLKREALARLPHRLLLWVSPAERIWLLRHAPNFCSRLSATFYFERSQPSSRQMAPALALLTRSEDDLLPRQYPRPRVEPYGALVRADRLREEIKTLTSPQERASAFFELASWLEEAPAAAGRAVEIHHSYLQAAESAQAANLPLLEAESLWRAGVFARFDPALRHSSRGELERSAQLFEGVIAAGGQEALRAEIGRAAALVGLASCDLMDRLLPAALEKLDAAARQYYAMGLYAGQAQALKSLGAVAGLMHDWQRATSALENAARTFERLGKKDQLAATLHFLGDAYFRQGRADAQELFARALALAKEGKDLLTEGNVTLSLGHISLLAGDLEEAEAYYLDALTLLRRLEFEPAIANTLLSLAGLLTASGRESEAQGAKKEADVIYQRWGLGLLVAALGADSPTA